MLTTHKVPSSALDRELIVRVYQPEGNGPFPVLYMHDGHNLFDRSTSSYNQIWQVQDAFAYDIAPMIVVGIDAPQDQRRLDELSPFANAYSKGLGDVYLSEVLRIKVFIDATYPTKPERDHTGIMGSSMGGVISTAALAKHSDVFSKFGLVSNAYWIDERLFHLIEDASIQPSKVYMDVGTKEKGIKDPDDYLLANHRMASILKAKGIQVDYHVYEGAQHNEREWAVRLPYILRYLFGGKR
jgi:predicted alpha/beta superfamily hydrolase